MSFDVPGEAYGRFMGRYSEPLAVEFLRSLAVQSGQRALDVGCGPGALTAPLAAALGASQVTAIDPSQTFVAAARQRLPEVDVRVGSVDDLPFADDTFDLTVASLVVHFMPDPVHGITEMARVTRPGGLVAVTAWDFGGYRDPLATYRQAVRELGLGGTDESALPGTRPGQLGALFGAAGLSSVDSFEVTVAVVIPSFEAWWQPLTLGVGPAGAHVAGLDEAARERLRERCAALLQDVPITVTATAWAARGRA